MPLLLFSAEKEVTIAIEGMTCPLCTTAIKRSLKKVDGVLKAKVRLNTQKATVRFDDAKADESELLKAIKRAGYTGKVITP
jgi:mercuric ion binding protein